jgi:seryl-tRNA synthetase
MLTLTDIRVNSEELIQRLEIRGIEAKDFIHKALNLDSEARKLRSGMESLKAESNAIAKTVGGFMKNKEFEKAEEAKKSTAELKLKVKSAEDALALIEEKLQAVLYDIPNAPQLDVPTGTNETDNVTILEWGDMPLLHEGAKSHWDLAADYDIVDFELGVKITGAGFPVYKGAGARLQRALINFFLDEAMEAGYKEIIPPLMVNEASGIGTGQLPDKEGQMYYVPKDDLYLIPTAEIPITNIYRDVILNESELPIKNTGYTPCFRREAGSYGSHVRGLNRLHQFDKVEIVQIVNPKDSKRVLDDMSNYVQGLLKKLGLKYRVLLLCGGDTGFASAKTYDMEVWSAAQERWLECSSVSNFETFQTNRLKCRYKTSDGKKVLAHSLNGSALALPRIMAALLENNQTADGISIPEVLQPYTRFDKIS